MGFGGWLKSVGKGILTGVKVAAPFAGAVGGMLPGNAGLARGLDTFSQVSQAILQTEVMFAALFGPDAKKGPDKLTATAPMIAQLILQSDAFIGKKIENPVLFEEGTRDLTSALVKIWGSVAPPPVVP